MGIKAGKVRSHWNYFLAIERDLEVLSRYVEFDSRNFKCFSLEIARILLAAGAEVDVVCKSVCRASDAGSTAATINAYRAELNTAIPEIATFEVLIPRFDLTLQPWEKWSGDSGVPLWWTAYNKIKHDRDSQYHQANLKNALNAVAGLFVVVLYLYRAEAEEGILLPLPQLVSAGDRHIEGFVVGGAPCYAL